MRLTNSTPQPIVLTVIPAVADAAGSLRDSLELRIGVAHPDDATRPMVEGQPSPVVDLDVWCKANADALDKLSAPAALLAHLRASKSNAPLLGRLTVT